MRRVLGLGVLLLLLVPAAPARALFHLWQVEEVFSGADGTVQFVELSTQFGSQQFLDGHFLRTEQANVALQTFTFPADLPGDSAGKTFLLATPGFVDVAGIEPDYEIPVGFIEVGVADEINFADVDSFPLAGLPTDGALALLDGGGTAPATPRNFAGEEGTIDVPEPQASWLGLLAAGVLAGLAVWQARRARPR